MWDKRVAAFRLSATARNADLVLDTAQEYDVYVDPAEYQRILTMGEILFFEDEFFYDPLSSSDRILFRLLIRLPEHRREALLGAVRSFRHH